MIDERHHHLEESSRTLDVEGVRYAADPVRKPQSERTREAEEAVSDMVTSTGPGISLPIPQGRRRPRQSAMLALSHAPFDRTSAFLRGLLVGTGFAFFLMTWRRASLRGHGSTD